MLCAGIDAGSRAIKVALVDADTGATLATALEDQGVDQDALATAVFARLLAQQGLHRDAVAGTVATGYARHNLQLADTTVTEITCHARGVQALLPAARTVIEIGGQDSKLIRLDDAGGVRDFTMNDRCAAGTGRFLEMAAARLGVAFTEAPQLLAASQTPATISSMCVVFAETEIIGLLAEGVAREDILAGVQSSIARRVAAMAGGQLDEPIVFTGGVALFPGMDAALAAALGREVSPVPTPQFTGAIGAALLAARRHHG